MPLGENFADSIYQTGGVIDNGESGTSGSTSFWDGASGLFNGFINGVSKFYSTQQTQQTQLQSQTIQSNAIVSAIKYLALAIGVGLAIKAIFSKR